jgi:hypothetical protein
MHHGRLRESDLLSPDLSLPLSGDYRVKGKGFVQRIGKENHLAGLGINLHTKYMKA